MCVSAVSVTHQRQKLRTGTKIMSSGANMLRTCPNILRAAASYLRTATR